MYRMPVYLRNFYFRKLKEQKDIEIKEQKKVNQKIKQSYKNPGKSSRYPGTSF